VANVDPSDVRGLSGHSVIDNHGERVGRVADVLFDEGSATPRWVLVDMGRVLHRQTAVPLQEAYRSAEGDLIVAYDKDEVKHAPRLTPNTVLTTVEERHLCQHYGLDASRRFDAN